MTANQDEILFLFERHALYEVRIPTSELSQTIHNKIDRDTEVDIDKDDLPTVLRDLVNELRSTLSIMTADEGGAFGERIISATLTDGTKVDFLGEAPAVLPAAPAADEDDYDDDCRNPLCTNKTDGGEGWDGFCGCCADIQESGRDPEAVLQKRADVSCPLGAHTYSRWQYDATGSFVECLNENCKHRKHIKTEF